MINLLATKNIPELTGEGRFYNRLNSTVKGCDTVEVIDGNVYFGVVVKQTGGFLRLVHAPGAMISSRSILYFEESKLERI